MKGILGFIMAILCSALQSSAGFLYASKYGATGDGITNDGPAIVKAIDALISASGRNTLIFEAGKKYYIKDIGRTYLFDLEGLANIEVDGAGSVFLLDGKVRFAHLNQSKNIHFSRLAVDYKPLPFADGLILDVNIAGKYIDVKISEGFEMPLLGGPLAANGEQAFFGMLWNQGIHAMLGMHYWVKDIKEAYPGSLKNGVLRIDAGTDFSEWDQIREGKTKISIPLRGVAHIGGDEVFRITECENVAVTEVDIWSAPWFAVGVTRNRGKVTFKKVNIQPKPGSGRLTSSWRDGFHVKGNYARLLWEDCRVVGTNDDAFNIASFMSTLQQADTDIKIGIRQNYPLDIIPYNTGDIVVVYDVVKGKILGKTKVVSAEGFVQSGKPIAPEIKLVLDKAIPGMSAGCQVWNESSANPKTTLRRCMIYNSCRFQSPITIEKSDLVALSWFYGSNLEGPLPSSVLIKDSRLLLGRGNPNSIAVVSSEMSYHNALYMPKEPVMAKFTLKNSVLDGYLSLNFVERVRIIGNNFIVPGAKLKLLGNKNVRLKNNY